MVQLKNFYYLDSASYRRLKAVTNDEVLFNYGERRPYGMIMSVGKSDYYVPMTHDLRLMKHPFLESAVYPLPSTERNFPDAGFDFQHALPIKDGAYSFTLNNQLIANDQRTLATNMQNQIASKLEKYVENYKHYQRGENLELVDGQLPDTRTFKVSTLNYFHEEIGLEPTFDIQRIMDKFSREDDLSLIENHPYVHYTNEAEISDAEDIQLVLNIFSEKEQDEIQAQSPWNLELIKGGETLGYLAYGESWSTEFDIQDELEDLQNRVRRNDYKNLYSEMDFRDWLHESGFEMDGRVNEMHQQINKDFLNDVRFNGNQKAVLQQGISKGLDVSIYADPKFDSCQMEQVLAGLTNELDVAIYAYPKFDSKQMEQIREGLEQKLDVSIYANSEFNAEQMAEIKSGLEVGVDVSIYANPQFDHYQMWEILEGLMDKRDVSIYAKPEFDNCQMQEIKLGMLRDVDVTVYANPEFNYDQMEQIREGLEQKLDVSIYANPEFNANQMEQIREGLKEGLDVHSYANPEFNVNQMEQIKQLEALKNQVRQNDDRAEHIQKYLAELPIVQRGKLQKMKDILSEEQVYSKRFEDIEMAKIEGFELLEKEFTPNKIYYYKNEEERKVIQFASENPKEIAKYFELILKNKRNVTYDFTKIDKDFGVDSGQTKNTLKNIKQIVKAKDSNRRSIEQENEMEI